MHGIFDIVLGITGWVVAIGLLVAGLFIALKKSDEPGKIVLKMLVSAMSLPRLLGSSIRAAAFARRRIL